MIAAQTRGLQTTLCPLQKMLMGCEPAQIGGRNHWHQQGGDMCSAWIFLLEENHEDLCQLERQHMLQLQIAA